MGKLVFIVDSLSRTHKSMHVSLIPLITQRDDSKHEDRGLIILKIMLKIKSQHEFQRQTTLKQ